MDFCDWVPAPNEEEENGQEKEEEEEEWGAACSTSFGWCSAQEKPIERKQRLGRSIIVMPFV